MLFVYRISKTRKLISSRGSLASFRCPVCNYVCARYVPFFALIPALRSYGAMWNVLNFDKKMFYVTQSLRHNKSETADWLFKKNNKKFKMVGKPMF